jgi:response regulator RpfG family c-di-GMP phosphodiesterase
MNERVLFVDDDPNILSGFSRQYHGKLNVVTAESGEKGIELLKGGDSFFVIISDYKMPKMNGAEFLEKAREISPQSIRILLSGQAELEGLMDVINKGSIFRFLTKPCQPDLLLKNINDAIGQYNLIQAEKDLLEKTLSGSIKMLVDILSVTSPVAFGKALRVRSLVKKYTETVNTEHSWQIEIAALLSQIGCVTISDTILRQAYVGNTLTPDEFRLFSRHAQTGSEMIANIPRLSTVAAIIAYQEKNFNGTGFPEDAVAGVEIPFGARLIKLASDFDIIVQSGRDPALALSVIKGRAGSGWYDPDLAEKFTAVMAAQKKYRKKTVLIRQLEDNMILAEDTLSNDQKIIVGHKGQVITKMLRITLANMQRGGIIPETIQVVYPVDD